MRIWVKNASWLLLPLAPLMLVGCDHKSQPTQSQTLAPPIVDTPPPKPATVSTADLPPPVVGDPQPAKATEKPSDDHADAPKKPVHHPRKPATPATTPTQEAANTPPQPPPSVSATGQFSGGASGDLRVETQETINATEKGVNGINRVLTDAELKTAAQIHEFLKEAREALTTGDVDGAHTLANKAKVLLTELSQ